MLDNAYVTSMFAVYSSCVSEGQSLTVDSKDNKDFFKFRKDITNDNLNQYDNAFKNVVTAAFLVLKAAGEDPLKHVEKLKARIKAVKKTEDPIGKIPAYQNNRATCLSGIVLYLANAKTIGKKEAKGIMGLAGKSKLAAYSDGVAFAKSVIAKKSVIKELADFEKGYVKLRTDKADSPFRELADIVGFIKPDFYDYKKGKEAEVELSEGRYVQRKVVGSKVVFAIKSGKEEKATYVDENGNQTDEDGTIKEDELRTILVKGDTIQEKLDKTAVYGDSTERFEKTAVSGDSIETRKVEGTTIEEKFDKTAVYGDSIETRKVEGTTIEEKFDKTAVSGDSIETRKVEGTTIEEKFDKTAVSGDSTERFEKTAVSGDSTERFEKTVVSGGSVLERRDYRLDYIKSHLESIRRDLMDKGLKDDKGYKYKFGKDAKFDENDEEMTKFFEQDGGDEYKEFALSINECIKLLGDAEKRMDKNSVISAIRKVNEASAKYVATHKGVLSYIGLKSSWHFHDYGDERYAKAKDLTLYTNLFENMLDQKYSAKSNMSEAEGKKEINRLKQFTDLRAAYVKKMAEIEPSVVNITRIATPNADMASYSSVDGFPKTVKGKATWYVIIKNLKNMLASDTALDDVMSGARNTSKVNKEIENLQKNPSFRKCMSKENATLADWEAIENKGLKSNKKSKDTEGKILMNSADPAKEVQNSPMKMQSTMKDKKTNLE